MVGSVSTPDPNGDNQHDDAELIARMQRGDELAVEILYLRYYPPLLRFTGSLVRSSELAEEIVQDTFLTLWIRRQDIDIRGNVRAYLYAAARNRALQQLKHQQVVQRTEADAFLDPSLLSAARDELGADTIIEANELAGRVMPAIALMPERRRVALLLRWRHRLPHAEIAEIMGTTVGAVMAQISRARETIEMLVTAYQKGGGTKKGYESYSLPEQNSQDFKLQRSSFVMQGTETTTVDEMISTMRRGLLLTRVSDLMPLDPSSMLCTGFTRDGRWLIENGKITKAVRNFRWTESPLFVFNNVESIGESVPTMQPGRYLMSGEMQYAVSSVVVPTLKINDFSFTSTIDAI